MELLIMHSSPASRTISTLLGPNILLSALFSDTLSWMLPRETSVRSAIHLCGDC